MPYRSVLRRAWAVALIACLLGPAEAGAQARQRLVEKGVRLLVVPEPIEIVEVAAVGRKIMVGQPFPAGEGWLKGLTIKAQNISGLPVRYVEFQAQAIRSGHGKPAPRFRLKYGRVPGVSADHGAGEAPGAEVKPGEFFRVSLNAVMYDSLRRSGLRDDGEASPETLRIHLSLVVFEGDRAWKNGYMSRRDGVNSYRWNVTDEDLEFIKPVSRVPGAGAQAPGFTVAALDGLKFDLARMRGKVVVLNFWFIGCSPCEAEIPELNKLVKDYADKDVVFVAIAPDGEAELRAFLKAVPFDFHVVPDGGAVLARYGLSGFPRHVVIGRDGAIRWAKTGNLSKFRDEFEGAIRGALEK